MIETGIKNHVFPRRINLTQNEAPGKRPNGETVQVFSDGPLSALAAVYTQLPERRPPEP